MLINHHPHVAHVASDDGTCDKDMPVYMTNQNGDMIEATVDELLPLGFSGKDLN